MTNPEQIVVNAIIAYVNKHPNSFVVKTNTTGLSKKQLDLVGSLRGVPFWVDAKAPGKQASKLQRGLVRLYRLGGYVSGVVDSVEGFRGLFY